MSGSQREKYSIAADNVAFVITRKSLQPLDKSYYLGYLMPIYALW